MLSFLRPQPRPALNITRNGRTVGTITRLSPTLWVAALNDPKMVVQGATLREVRDTLRVGKL